MKTNKIIHIEDKSSFVLDAQNMPDTIILEKSTNYRTSSTGDKFSIGEKADIPVATFLLKNKNIVYHAVVYETIFTNEIKKVFNEIVEKNNLTVLDNVVLAAPSSSYIPRSYLGDGKYKTAQIINERDYD